MRAIEFDPAWQVRLPYGAQTAFEHDTLYKIITK